jgi:Family of unknown function (DUF6152)
MTSITRRLFLSLAAALAPGAAIAHHGWGGYDTSKSFTVTGKILKSTYENPHCEIEMEVDGGAASRRTSSHLARPAPCSATPISAIRTRRGLSTSFSTASASNCGRPEWNTSRPRRSSLPCRRVRWGT